MPFGRRKYFACNVLYWTYRVRCIPVYILNSTRVIAYTGMIKFGKNMFPFLRRNTQRTCIILTILCIWNFFFLATLYYSLLDRQTQPTKQEMGIYDPQTAVVSNASLSNLTLLWQQNNTQTTKRPKYFLTEVVRVRLYKEDKARWTVKEFKQWLHYMLWAGVEHIFVCNHYLDESERIESYLQKYVEKGLVTVIPWTFRNPRKGQEDYVSRIHDNQIGCYNYFLMGNGSDTVWQMSLDMDEYPFCMQDQSSGFLRRYLQEFSSRPSMKNVTVIGLQNFLMLGGGDRTRDMLIDRINRMMPNATDGLYKPVYKTNCTVMVGIHNVKADACPGAIKVKSNSTELRMLHYWGSRAKLIGLRIQEIISRTVEFNLVRDTIGRHVRESLLSFGENDAFSNSTGP